MARWRSRYPWMLVHPVRMTMAGVAAFASADAFGLPQGLSAAITAIVVTQSNVGGTLKRALEQFIGALLGAIYAAAVAFAISPDDVLSSAVALGIALAPLSILAARSVGFLVAPVTAAVVLLGGAGFCGSIRSLPGLGLDKLVQDFEAFDPPVLHAHHARHEVNTGTECDDRG